MLDIQMYRFSHFSVDQLGLKDLVVNNLKKLLGDSVSDRFKKECDEIAKDNNKNKNNKIDDDYFCALLAILMQELSLDMYEAKKAPILIKLVEYYDLLTPDQQDEVDAYIDQIKENSLTYAKN